MKKNKIIIALASTQGAGKTFFSNYLAEKYSAETIKYSAFLTAILKKFKIENSRQNLQELSLILRNNFGENILELGVLKKIENSKNNIIVIDGVRRQADIQQISQLTNFYLIFIDADLEIRVQRIAGRGEKSDDLKVNREQILKESQHNSETRETELKAMANFIIENNDNIEKFKDKIDLILEKI